jgi:protein farnesyltransferase/geranylgeranyltransferase type-1 subunit alpha
MHRQYRYETLLALSSSLETELELMNDLAIKYLKTYQVWHHRRLLLTHLRTPQPELKFIGKCLQVDSKNYHTWSYRQWLLSHFVDDNDLWKGELDFVENMIGDDVRNNSAWHHRHFVVFGCGVRAGEEDRARVVRRELM